MNEWYHFSLSSKLASRPGKDAAALLFHSLMRASSCASSQIPTEIVNKLPQFDYSSLEQYLTESTEPRRSRCMIIPHPKIIDIINGFKGINEDVILRNRAVAKMPRPPPPPSEYMTSSCEKHSRCHCNLLSKKVDGFFNVTSQ